MQKTINGIVYRSRAESNARLISKAIEGQTPLMESQESIDARSYQLSERNGANAYIIPIEQEKVYLNFIAQKVYVDDRDILNTIQPDFEYFVEDIVEEIPSIELEDGIFFRCATNESVPKPKESYTYYVMMDGVAKQIPDYKTLEVMLAERNLNYLSVRVLEKSQCDDIPRGTAEDGAIPSKASAWKEDYADQTSFEALRKLEETVASAQSVVDANTAAASEQIAAVQAQAKASSDQAAASAAQAAAAQAASAAAIAQAQAAQAAAEAAKAEAEAAKAQAESGQG